MMMRQVYFLLLTACSLLFSSCHRGSSYFPRSIEPIEVSLVCWDTTYTAEMVADIADDSVFLQVVETCRERYADTRKIEADLNQSFSRIHYLYPEWPIPTVYLSVTGFQASNWLVDDTTIVVGADLYLGADYPYYEGFTYQYQRHGMRPECVVGDVLCTYLFRHIPYTASQQRLLDQMIYRGKVLYLLGLLLDKEPEYEIIGYTRDQWQWCRDNEAALWAAIMDRRDLFTTDFRKVASYMNDGPFCNEISQECPARVGTWLGMQIVRSYMEHNEDATIQQLMADGDSQTILTKSYYKP